MQAYTGHKDITTLIRRYIHVGKGEAEDVAVRLTWRPPELRDVSGDEGDEG